MNLTMIEREFKEKVCNEVSLVGEGLNRYIVHQPFMFDDGDHFVVLLKRENDRWVLTDEGHTLMHVQYDDIDLQHGMRARLLDSALRAFSVENHEGELRVAVPDNRFGDALFSFLQALNKITDLDYLSRERAHAAFTDDCRALIEELIPEDRRTFNYHDAQRDPDGNYAVDCRINGTSKANFVFFISSDFRCQNATIVCHQFERWGTPFRATGIFEDQAEINRRAVAQFSDVAYKQIPSLGSRERIEAYFEEILKV